LVPVTSVLLAAEQSGDLRVGARCPRHDLVKCANPLTDLRREPGQHGELLPGVVLGFDGPPVVSIGQRDVAHYSGPEELGQDGPFFTREPPGTRCRPRRAKT
jgi:hypothetical protein